MASITRHRQQKIRKELRQGKKHTKGNVRADINMTPLIDVVLVLLIIFMVVTPMIASGVAVDLPKTENHTRKPDDGKDIIISVTAAKKIHVGQRMVALTELQRVLTDEKRRTPDKSIFVKADYRATYGTVREVMEVINKTGIEDIMLGTEELKNAPKAASN
jgi:biopolymer transport protein ExbD/biopolymer transport protein TolR